MFLPIHTKTSKVNKTSIKIIFNCNHSGKTKETCKGRDCLYKLSLTLGFNKTNCIVESGTHNHSLDYSFVVSKTCPLLKKEKELIPINKQEFIEFIAKHPNIHVPLKKYRQLQRTENKNTTFENTFLSELSITSVFDLILESDDSALNCSKLSK